MLQFINHIELKSAILSLIFVFIHVSISYMHKANENFVMQNMYDLKSIFIKKKIIIIVHTGIPVFLICKHINHCLARKLIFKLFSCNNISFLCETYKWLQYLCTVHSA